MGGVFRPNTEEPCYTGQYTFANTSAETARWDLSVPRAQVEGRMSPNPYRAFAYLQFCEGKPMSSCWAGAAGAAGGAGGAGGARARGKRKQPRNGKKRFMWPAGLPPVFQGDWWPKEATDAVNKARMQILRRLVRRLVEHHHNYQGIFNTVVDTTHLPTYTDLVKSPMDLGTVRRRLEAGQYVGVDSFATDVRLVFGNAMMFNPPGHYVHTCAQSLGVHFEEWLASVDPTVARPHLASPGLKRRVRLLQLIPPGHTLVTENRRSPVWTRHRTNSFGDEDEDSNKSATGSRRRKLSETSLSSSVAGGSSGSGTADEAKRRKVEKPSSNLNGAASSSSSSSSSFLGLEATDFDSTAAHGASPKATSPSGSSAQSGSLNPLDGQTGAVGHAATTMAARVLSVRACGGSTPLRTDSLPHEPTGFASPRSRQVRALA